VVDERRERPAHGAVRAQRSPLGAGPRCRPRRDRAPPRSARGVGGRRPGGVAHRGGRDADNHPGHRIPPAPARPRPAPPPLARPCPSLADAGRVAGLLPDMTTDERRAIPPMAPGREDVIPAGAAILVEAMRRWGFDRALVSETDILDGLLLRLVREADGRAKAG